MSKRDLTKDKIVREALSLLDSEGLDGLSMRKLAARLKVQAPTLYYHIPDKSALLNEVVLTLFQDVFARMPHCETWPDWMREFGRAIWDVQQEARYSPLLILTTQLDEQHFAQSVELAANELRRFDADQEQLFFVQTAVQAVITGWSVFAHSAYSEKMGRFVDFREAALNSVDTLVAGWGEKLSAPKRRRVAR